MALTALVTIGANQYLFDSALGTDLGNYVDPQGQFVQNNRLVTRNDTPLSVEFHVDQGTNRLEIWFNNFKAFGAANAAAAHIGSYSVQITNGNNNLVTISTPSHWWGSTWRYNPTPRPLRTTAANLIASKLIPPLRTLAYHTPTPIDWSKVVYTTMGNAGLRQTMGDTAARPDIGLINDWAAHYILNPTAQGLAGVQAIAETSGSVPWHIMDESTGAPVDLAVHTNANWYYQQTGSEWIKRDANQYQIVNGVQGPVPGTLFSPWQTDYSHHCDTWYVPFLLTGDPYYLREGHYMYHYFLGDKGSVVRNGSGVPLIPRNQGRGWAWMLRDLLNLITCTPAITPNWLIPRATFQSWLDAERVSVTNIYVNGQTPATAVFRYGPQLGQPGLSFSDSFQSYVLSNAIYRGFTAWQGVADWKWGEIDARLNGTSGWDHQTPTVYTNPQITTETTWSQLYATWFSQNSGIVITPHTNTTDYMTNAMWEYLGQMRFAAGMAKLAGQTNATYDFAFVDHMTVQANFDITASLSLDPSMVVIPPPQSPRLTAGIGSYQLHGYAANLFPSYAPPPPQALTLTAGIGSFQLSGKTAVLFPTYIIPPPPIGTIDPMTFTITVGQTRPASVKFTDAAGVSQPVYSVPVWTCSPPGAVTLNPSANGFQCNLTGAVVNANVTISCAVECNPTPGVNRVTASTTGVVNPVAENDRGVITVV